MKWSKTSSKCITCEFWSGSRKLASFGRYAETDDVSDKGACCHPSSASKHIENKNPADTCSKWEAWGQLI